MSDPTSGVSIRFFLSLAVELDEILYARKNGFGHSNCNELLLLLILFKFNIIKGNATKWHDYQKEGEDFPSSLPNFCH